MLWIISLTYSLSYNKRNLTPRPINKYFFSIYHYSRFIWIKRKNIYSVNVVQFCPKQVTLETIGHVKQEKNKKWSRRNRGTISRGQIYTWQTNPVTHSWCSRIGSLVKLNFYQQLKTPRENMRNGRRGRCHGTSVASCCLSTGLKAKPSHNVFDVPLSQPYGPNLL